MVKKLNLQIVLLIVLFCGIEVLAVAKDYKVEDEIKLPILDKKFNYKVVDIKYVDLDGDNEIEEILLLAGKEINSEEEYSRLADSEIVLVREKDKKIIKKINTGNEEICPEKIFIGDFDGDKIKDIMIISDTNANGGLGMHEYNIYKYDKGIFKDIYKKNKVWDMIDFDGELLDNYKAKFYNRLFNQTIIIKIEGYEDFYINGKKTEDADIPAVEAVALVEPVDFDKDGMFELIGYRYVYLGCRAAGLGTIRTIIKYNRNNRVWEWKKSYFSE